MAEDHMTERVDAGWSASQYSSSGNAADSPSSGSLDRPTWWLLRPQRRWRTWYYDYLAREVSFSGWSRLADIADQYFIIHLSEDTGNSVRHKPKPGY
jgi:hypothetical protein